MKRKCATPGCKELVEPVKTNRAYFPYCSPECRDAGRAAHSDALATASSLTSNTGAGTIIHASFHRKHGSDNRKASIE